MRYVGTVSRGIRLPVVTRGADIVKIISDSIINAAESERDKFEMRDHDIVGVTESLVARSQGNYVTLEDISNDVAKKFHPHGGRRGNLPDTLAQPLPPTAPRHGEGDKGACTRHPHLSFGRGRQPDHRANELLP